MVTSADAGGISVTKLMIVSLVAVIIWIRRRPWDWQMAVLPYSVKIMPDLNRHPKPPSPLVVALAYDGLCTFEFGVAVEAFGLARPEMGDNWYRFAVAGVEPGALRATGGIRLMVDGGLELLAQA